VEVIAFRRHGSKPTTHCCSSSSASIPRETQKNTRLIPILSKYADDTDLAWRRDVPDA
jgi:hypothetical protein